MGAVRCWLYCCGFLLLLLVLNGCGGGSGGSSAGGSGSSGTVTPTVISVIVTPASPSVAAGLTQQLAATAQLSDGTTRDVTATAKWQSSAPGVATVSASGLVTAVKPGPVTIAAAVGTVSGTAAMTVGAPVVTGLTVTPGASTVAAGLSQQFTAIGTFSDGSTGNVTGSVTWSSGTGSVATVGAGGLATSVAQGTATITASSGAVSASATLTVTAPELAYLQVTPANATVAIGATAPQAFTATEVYTDHSTRDVTGSVTWSVSNALVASIGSGGAASAGRAGYTKVVATAGNLTATAGLAVLATPRYLYSLSDGGEELTRMAVNAQTGQAVFEGDQAVADYNSNWAGDCLTTDPTGKYLYKATAIGGLGGTGGTAQISQFTMDAASGTAAGSAQNPATFPQATGCIQFVPSGKFAYAITPYSSMGNNLTTFAVGAGGSLTEQYSTTLPYFPSGLAVDPLGQYLYLSVTQLATGGSAWIYGYSIDGSSGNLTPIPRMPAPARVLSSGHFAFHPSGDFLYYSDDTYNTITEYRVNRSTGALTSEGSISPPCTQPLALQFSPDATHAYGACSFGANNNTNAPLLVYAAGANGQLTQTGSVNVGMDPMQVLADPSAQYVYVLGCGNDWALDQYSSATCAANLVMVYRVQKDGTLALVNQMAGRFFEDSMALLSGPQPVHWSPTYAYVSTSGDNKLTGYAVQPDGTLTQTQSPGTQNGPFAATMLPWGSDLLLASQAAAPNLQAYTVASDGTLTASSNFGLTATTGGLVMDASGGHAYASDPAAGTVHVYARSSVGTWATLYNPTPTQPWTFTAGAGTGPVTTDPSGRYMIAANQTAKSLSLFGVDEGSSSSTALSFTPLAIEMDPTGNILFVAGDDGNVHMLASNGLGTLTDEAQGSTAGNAESLAVTPDGRFVYAAGMGGLSAFAVSQQAKTLTPVALNVAVSLEYATGVWLDPSGQYLYSAVSNGSTNAMYLFTVNADGTLTLTSSTPVATPNHATSMVFREKIQ